MAKDKEEKSKSVKNRKRRYYEPIIKRSKYWPVVQLSKHRNEFVEEVVNETFEKLKKLKSTKKELIEEIETTRYREKQRMRSNPWKVDPPDEKDFWDNVKKDLVELSAVSNGKEQTDEVLKTIIGRYAEEIAGNFKSNRYRVTRSIVKFGFRRLLNAARVKGMFAIFKSDYYLTDKIQIFGKTKLLRKLAKDHTIVMVPTHFSHLDSILIGWIIHVLGLPPFIYGAGLNLFNIGIFAYFMNSLGAYKVDRRKRNMIYLETLKMYSHLALMKGAHSLFFPGGTRSRSGHLETKLKRGLLGTTVEAQRSFLLNPETEKKRILVVPVVINYHFTFEAPELINDYLKKTGQERYYREKDGFTTSYKIMQFLVKFFTKGSNISVSIGRPMDAMGNLVNENGESLDKNGRVVELKDYFMSNGQITIDEQRENEYTRILSEKIIEEYHRSNRVFASQLVAWVAFRHWKKEYSKLDLFSFLRQPEEELSIDYEDFKKEVSQVLDMLRIKASEKKLKLAKHLRGNDIDEIIKMGVNNVGMYHVKRPLLLKNDKIITQSLNTLYYYHNRMDGYELEF